jgi:hypothetical protein
LVGRFKVFRQKRKSKRKNGEDLKSKLVVTVYLWLVAKTFWRGGS